MSNATTKKIIVALLCIVIAAVSFFFLAERAASPDLQGKTIAALDEKETTVLRLTAAATAASAAITLIPGDAGTPIAEKLVDLTDYFMIVLCALFLEKYIVAVSGFLAFKILIPAACGLLLASLFAAKGLLRDLARKFATLAIVLFLLVPCSMGITNLIETTYETSIQQTIESAEDSAAQIEENVGNAPEEDESLILGKLKKLFSNVTEGINGVSEYFENLLRDFIQAAAIMLVTSCVIPVFVLLLLLWLARTILRGAPAAMPDWRMATARGRRHRAARNLGAAVSAAKPEDDAK